MKEINTYEKSTSNSVSVKIEEYKTFWKQYINRKYSERIKSIIIMYNPKERRNVRYLRRELN